MKNLIKLSGIIVILAVVIGFTACDLGGGRNGIQPSTLTVTNFSGILTQDHWIIGSVFNLDDENEIDLVLIFTAVAPTPENIYAEGAKITGRSITLNVYFTEDFETFALYTGNDTIEVDDNFILIETDTKVFVPGVTETVNYTNKVPITFTNGHATINFETDMEPGGGIL